MDSQSSTKIIHTALLLTAPPRKTLRFAFWKLLRYSNLSNVIQKSYI